MLQPIPDLPTGVLGFEAKGKIEASDYRDALQPAIEKMIADGNDVRIVLVFESFDGMTGAAAWEDMKMGVGHLRHWERIALVTDVEWMTHLTSLFGWMTPGDLRHFPLAERDQAIAWVSEK